MQFFSQQIQVLKVIENSAATVKGRILEQISLCGRFATHLIREQIFLR